MEKSTPKQNNYGPRSMSFFTLVIKTLAGFAGGVSGAIIMVLIFLGAFSLLQPLIQGTPTEASAQTNPVLIVIIMAMVFAASLVANMVGPLLLAYTERERYNRLATTMGQVFIINLVIFIFVIPVYLTTFQSSTEVTAFAAGLQVILSTTASALILELMHDSRYALVAIYSTILAMLASIVVSFLLYLTGSGTILLFTTLPIIWGFIGFSQGAVGIFYYWVFQTWGTDYLATATSLGTDYGIPEQAEESEPAPDLEGQDFLKQ